MLLRRIMNHVKDQNWTAIALDFFIVIVGVFIGIQVSNWNDARVEREVALKYIDRIQQDLLANQQDMKMRSEYFTGLRDHALAALYAPKETADALGEQFLIDSFIASFSLRRSYQRNTFDELLSAGAMNTIPNVEVRNRIAEYYRVAGGSQHYMNSIPAYADALRRTMPYDVQTKLREGGCNAQFFMQTDGATAAIVPRDCPLEISAEQVEEAIGKLIAADLEPELTRALADFDLKLQIFQVWIDRAQNLYDYLDETK